MTQYLSLKHKTVFITGAASGIGAAMVKAFYQQNCNVAFVDINQQQADLLIDSLNDENHRIWFTALDVTDVEKLKQAVVDAQQHFSSLDILVNNVANDMRHDPTKITEAEWHKCMQVNLDPAFFASQAAYQFMAQKCAGSIINLSSINALMGPKNMTGYVTAKAGLMGLTKALANDFGNNNVRVNAILPGWVATEKQLATWLTEQQEQQWTEQMALKTRLLPEDIANLALFLASDDSKMITGQGITIDGGRTL